ncbi:MAG: tetratricopeptide repeat protein [Flavobacterium sp.]|nr:tetratricopeptide repeat protein [Flavobacterium sp.]PZO26725.1 MAG: tetratricopeptide repeat protein [Flavobacteriaceae bacterium]PZQ78481.1 MAG: tetratricopeptide repeat protein [Flavobacterium johnsoniae]
MKKTICLALFFLSISAYCQDSYKNFQDALKANDTTKQLQILTQWEKSNAKDPELYTSYYNYYFSKSRQEVVSIDKENKGKESLKLVDSTGNVAGYMGSSIVYDTYFLKKAFESIDKGISKFPNRLDMRFGKIYGLGLNKDYEAFTKEIIKTIEQSGKNNNKWLWTLNKPVDDPENFMLGNIQSYVEQLYNTGNDNLLKNIKRISETVLKYNPKHVESLSNISIFYIINKEYDKSLQYSLKAHQINPSDAIVLGNIAYTYKEKGDKANAIKFYKLTLEHGDESAKQQAQKALDKLKQGN